MKNFALLLFTFIVLQASAQSTSTTSTSLPSGCSGFLTYTQGGWGATPSGNNPGTYLHNNFAAAFPSGLTIGCNNKIVFTSAAAITSFLPSSSTATTLPAGVMVNPSRYSNVLAGQLTAATLSVGFDLSRTAFAPSAENLKNLKISKGAFFDKTVGDVIEEANRFIGGCGSTYTASALNSILTSINTAYDNGVMSGNLLICPIQNNVQSVNVSCFGGNNGSISITNVSGAAGAPYTYRWNTGATTSSIGNLNAGVYTVTISDRIRITKVQSITITQPSQLNATSSATAILCNGGSSTVTVEVNGGTAPYSGTGTFSVTAGTYQYTVTDANGCTSTTSVTIGEPTKLNATSSATAVLCNGGSSTVTVEANGGTAPYSGTGTFSVTAGTYQYTVTDANGCTSTTSVTIGEPTKLNATSSATAILCNGGSSTVTVEANGGTAPYSGTGTFSVTAGTYQYTVTDANGCTSTTSVTIGEPDLIVLEGSISAAFCSQACSGIASIAVSGGVAPYFYSWTPNSSDSSSAFVCTGQVANVTVTDALGCSVGYEFDPMTCTQDECLPLKTFTIGGWGARAAGQNPGVYRDANFAYAFPAGLIIGSIYTLELRSSAAVEAFLPSGGTPVALTSNLVNPLGNIYKNTFASQLVAAVLNTTFDRYDPNFAAPATNLSDMYCNFAPFVGMTVADVINEGSLAIGGQTSSFSITELNDALTLINENYDNGTSDEGNLTCLSPLKSVTNNKSASSADLNASKFLYFPNPVSDVFNIELNTSLSGKAEVVFTDLLGRTVFASEYNVSEGLNTLSINRDKISSADTKVFMAVKFLDQVFHSGLIWLGQR